MPSKTCLNLDQEKQDRIRKVLIAEFSRHPLAQAQVAPIVKQARIARGAFYKYFRDLADAYAYVYRLAMDDIHQEIDLTSSRHDADYYAKYIQEFLDGSQDQGYYSLIRMHLLYNEAFISHPAEQSSSPLQRTEDQAQPRVWAVAELCHATLRDCLVQEHPSPDYQKSRLSRLKACLDLLLKSDSDKGGAD